MTAKCLYLVVGALEVATSTRAEASVSALQGALLDGEYTLEAPIMGTLFHIPDSGFIQVDAEGGDAEGHAQGGHARMVRVAKQATLEEQAIAATVEATGEAEAQAATQGHGRWPRNISDIYGRGKYLRSGSFGEAWGATDSDGKQIVIKIFYDKNQYGEITYLTRENTHNKPALKSAVTEAVQECKLAQRIVKYAPAGDPGKDRIVNCIKSAVPKGRYELLSYKEQNQPLYLVLQHGGKSVEQWIMEDSWRADETERRNVIGMILQGLRTMGELLPRKLVHHDLKPANAVYDPVHKVARLIDFGGTMEGTASNRYTPAVATPAYAPPEFLGTVPDHSKVAFEMPAVSYDMYAVGMMYAEVMCGGKISYNDIYAFARSRDKSRKRFQRILALRSCTLPNGEIDLILSMMSFYASSRPLPSVLLKARPCDGCSSGLHETPGEQDEDLAASEHGGDELSRSIVPKNDFNPNARGKRAVVQHFVDNGQAGWEGSGEDSRPGPKKCEFQGASRSRVLMNMEDFRSGQSTRTQCEERCIAHEASNREAMFLIMSSGSDKSSFCCQLNLLATKEDYQSGRQCEWGWGRTVDSDGPGGIRPVYKSTDGSRVGFRVGAMTGQWARALPFTAAPELEVVPETPDVSGGEDSRSFNVGDKVRVKFYHATNWKTGYVTKVDGPLVLARLLGQDKSYTWPYMEKIEIAAPAVAPRARGGQDLPLPDAHQFVVGQRVRVMDDPLGDMAGKAGFISSWREGEVVSVNRYNVPKVLADGMRTAFTFGIVEPLGRVSPVQRQTPKKGQRVQCRDHTDEGWSYGILEMTAYTKYPAYVILNGVFLEKMKRNERAGLARDFGLNALYGTEFRIAELIALNVGDPCEFKKETSTLWKPCTVMDVTDGDYTIRAEPLVGRWQMTSPSYIVHERITLSKDNLYELEPVSPTERVYD